MIEVLGLVLQMQNGVVLVVICEELLECICQEVIFYGICIDIVEELVCLFVYLGEICYIFKKGGQVGKCFDFMMQELNCEVNMVGFKVVVKELVDVFMELKLFIDQMCE